MGATRQRAARGGRGSPRAPFASFADFIETPFSRRFQRVLLETCDIIAVLEAYYRAQLPDLRLVRWSHAIYEYLTHPLLDPTGTKRVAMGYLTKFIRSVVESAYTKGLTDVTGKLVAERADWITYHAPHILHINDASEPTATS